MHTAHKTSSGIRQRVKIGHVEVTEADVSTDAAHAVII
jgi:hypothetical protein